MIATVRGMIVEIGSTEKKDQYGRGFNEPFVVLYSGGEAVKISGIDVDPGSIGAEMEIESSVKLWQMEDRCGISVKPLKSRK